MHLEFGSYRAALDFNDFAGFKQHAKPTQPRGDLRHIQSMGKLLLFSVAPDYRDRKYDLPAKLTPF